MRIQTRALMMGRAPTWRQPKSSSLMGYLPLGDDSNIRPSIRPNDRISYTQRQKYASLQGCTPTQRIVSVHSFMGCAPTWKC